MASRRRDLGALSPRLLQLSAKTIPVEPYQVTENVVIRQTRQRRDDLHAAYSEIVSGTQQIQALIRRASELPQPEAPAEDDAEALTAYAAAVGAWQAQIDIMDSRADEITAQVNAAGERYNRAFFGDAYADIMELSADWDAELFDAFKADVNAHFLGGVNPPPDGTDEDGTVVDVAEAVEAGK